jgi:hypothetical protein
MKHTKVCPRCLEEEGYDRLYWMVRGLVICPYHHIRLVELCPSCQQKIPSLRPSVLHCPHCATGDYRRAPSHLFPEEHLLSVASSIFYQALGIPLPSPWRLPPHLTPSPLLGISATHYFRLLERIAFEFFSELPQHTLLTVLGTIHSSGSFTVRHGIKKQKKRSGRDIRNGALFIRQSSLKRPDHITNRKISQVADFFFSGRCHSATICMRR